VYQSSANSSKPVSSTNCTVDHCIRCVDNTSLTCTSCDAGWYKKTFSGGVKSYDVCWNLMKLLGMLVLSCCLCCCFSACCYFCYKRGANGKKLCEFAIGGRSQEAPKHGPRQRQNPARMSARPTNRRKLMYQDTTSRQSIASMQTQRVRSPRLVPRPRKPQGRIPSPRMRVAPRRNPQYSTRPSVAR
jgi:hypothetical protein